MQSEAVSIDAPVEGWDAFHSLDDMPPAAAVILDNIIPGAGRVDTRKGYTVFADLGTSAAVETVASLESATLVQLVAASDGGLWEIDGTTVTPVTNAAQGTFTVNKWQYANFRKADESGIMVLCNGTDKAQVYTGNTPGTGGTVVGIDHTGTGPPLWDVATEYQIGDEVQEPLDTYWIATQDSVGETPSGGSAFWDSIPNNFSDDFIGCIAFKGRMYYWRDNDDSFWYTQAGSYQGEFQQFDLGSVVQRGGKLVYITSWTQQDSGDGKDDFIVFVFSTGEVLVYQGDDPEGVGFFEMVGRYLTGEPLSIRGSSKYGSDAIIMTKDGYVSLSSIIQEGRTSDVPQFSRLIHSAVTDRTETRSQLYGWDCELFPKDGLFVFNVPLSGSTFEQHVMNTVTQRWCRFKNINVNCITVHDERLFGGNATGEVHALLEGTSDDGSAIEFACLYAFNYLGNAGVHKHVTAAQVLTTHSRPGDIQLTGYADFDVPDLPPIILPTGIDQGIWSVYPVGYPPWVPPLPADPDQSPIGSSWDEAYWSLQNTPYTTKGWQNVSAFGYAVSLLVRFAKVNETVSWRSTNLRFFYAGSQ